MGCLAKILKKNTLKTVRCLARYLAQEMAGKTNNKIDRQNRQDAIEADIVDKYLINNLSREKINIDYYIDQKASLKKKLQTWNSETEQIEVKPKNNLVIQLNTAAFQFIVQKMLPFLIQNEQLEIEMKQTLDAMQNIIQDTFKIYSKQSNRRSKHDYTINCYRTTSNILINGPGVTKFMNNELKLIAKILEDNKIQINTQNIQLKSILYNITTETSHKESKSITTTDTVNETKTCIGESDKNEQEQSTEAKTSQYNYQNENETQNTSCEICNNEDHDKMIECSECKK